MESLEPQKGCLKIWLKFNCLLYRKTFLLHRFCPSIPAQILIVRQAPEIKVKVSGCNNKRNKISGFTILHSNSTIHLSFQSRPWRETNITNPHPTRKLGVRVPWLRQLGQCPQVPFISFVFGVFSPLNLYSFLSSPPLATSVPTS